MKTAAIKLHSVTFAALCSPPVRAILWDRPANSGARMIPTLAGTPVEADDREPRNALLELVCKSIEENTE